LILEEGGDNFTIQKWGDSETARERFLMHERELDGADVLVLSFVFVTFVVVGS